MKDEKASSKDVKGTKKKQQLAVKEKNTRKRQGKKDRKVKKDPNKPKRAPTAFFVFLEEFRETYKKEHPNVKGVTVVGKACGDKWKEMSVQDKAPYVKKATEKKAEYDKALASYNKKLSSPESPQEEEADGSERSKSEVNDEDDDEEEEDDD